MDALSAEVVIGDAVAVIQEERPLLFSFFTHSWHGKLLLLVIPIPGFGFRPFSDNRTLPRCIRSCPPKIPVPGIGLCCALKLRLI